MEEIGWKYRDSDVVAHSMERTGSRQKEETQITKLREVMW